MSEKEREVHGTTWNGAMRKEHAALIQ